MELFTKPGIISHKKLLHGKKNLEQEDEGVPSTSIREISLKEIQHPNVVKLLDVVSADQI